MKRRQFITLLGGATAAWPIAVRAQQPGRIRRVIFLGNGQENDPRPRVNAAGFRDALQRQGWTVGRNLQIDYRWGAIDPERARAYATEFAASAPDVIFAQAGPVVTAMREQTRMIPIVFTGSGDPVQAGSVQSFARPGGNVTGFVSFEATINAKYLQLLKDIAPNVTRVAVLQFENSTWRGDFSAIEAVARSYAVTPIAAVVHDDGEIERAIAALAQEPNGGLILPPDANTNRHRDLIVALGAKHHLPGVYSDRSFVDAGGLLSYGADDSDLIIRAASYVDRILRGEKPSDLPVQGPTKFELVINLKTAKALGLNVTPSLQMGASEVIE